MPISNPLLDSPLLQEFAPCTVAGYAHFRAIVDRDGALPARLKHLFVAVAAVNKRYRDLARRELQAACSEGLALEQAAAGLILLSSLRGEGAALAFQAILDDVYPPRPKPAKLPPPVAAAPGEAADNFRQYFGSIPDALARLLDLSPAGAEAYYLMRKGTIEHNTLDRKHAELLLVTVLASDYSPMAETHIRGARSAGASDAELAEAILCAVPTAGLAAWIAAGSLLAAP